MDLQTRPLRPWLAALALTLPAVLAFNAYEFWVIGSLVVPVAAYGAATGTGYARKDALAIAAGSGVLVAVGGIMSAPIVAYAFVAALAIRPSSPRAVVFRLVTLLPAVLLAERSNAWWAALLIPALVAATDQVVDSFGAGGCAEGTLVEESRQARPAARRALTAASLSCLLLVTLPWLSKLLPGVALVFLGFASAAAGVVLALRAAHADPFRAVAALLLSTLPIIVLGFYILIVLGGGIQL